MVYGINVEVVERVSVSSDFYGPRDVLIFVYLQGKLIVINSEKISVM